MWLDGVFMIPLILLGVHRIVSGGSVLLLAVSVGISMLSNWYTGCINCLFSAFWLFFEWCLARAACPERLRVKAELLTPLLKYALAMLIGICLSMILFLPTWSSLQNSRGVELNRFYNGFCGNPLNIIAAYSMATGSDFYYTTLFCGSLPILGCMAYFVGKGPSVRKKVTVGAMLMTMVLLFYYQPFYMLFSLLRQVTSYYCRFAYGGSLCLIFVAAMFCQEAELPGKRLHLLMLLCAAVMCVRAAESLYMGDTVTPTKWVVLTAVFFAVICCAFFLLYRCPFGKKQPVAVLLMIFTILELSCNAWSIFVYYKVENMESYAAYQEDTQAQIDAIKSYDTENYRISQTSTRYADENNLTSYYNDALAHGYASITSYTSDPDLRQRTLLDHLGYRVNGATYNIVNTSILTADSLLGVKYILSDYEISGLAPVEDLETPGTKKVYENPYCLPMAFTYSGELPAETDTENPFLYQNAIYSALSGGNAALYTPIPYTVTYSDQAASYTLTLPEGDYAFYGNIVWEHAMAGILNVNGTYSTGYAMWASPSVFYIPADGNTAEITLTTEKELAILDAQFYALDLNLLQSVSKKISADEASSLRMENGNVQCIVNGKADAALFLSVPYNSGWTVTRNGEPVEPQLFEDCLMLLPLVDGENEFVLEYRVPGLSLGIVISSLAFLALVLCGIRNHKRKKVVTVHEA